MDITYKLNAIITSDQFIELLHKSSLGERRPIDDELCIKGMLNNSNLIISAWFEDQLVGIARSVTDFHYACYLSDLAVSREFQKHGIGKELQRLTQLQLGPKCKLILLAAPLANDYYAPLGYQNNPRCWVLEPDVKLIH
jgi:GNAT superfamily N-acetyltransferase